MNTLKTLKTLILAAAALPFAANEARADADFRWNSPSGQWDDLANWIDAASIPATRIPAPANYDSVLIDNGGTAFVDTAGCGAELLTIGEFNKGTLEITDGSFSCRNMTIGAFAGSEGRMVISGGECSVPQGRFHLGESGTGVMEITGGSLSNDSCIIGVFAGGDGTVTVTGGEWRAGAIYVGGEGDWSFERGHGRLIIRDAGKVDVVSLFVDVNGVVNIGAAATEAAAAAGTLDTGSIVNDGIFQFNHTRTKENPYRISSEIPIGGMGKIVHTAGVTVVDSEQFACAIEVNGGTLFLNGGSPSYFYGSEVVVNAGGVLAGVGAPGVTIVKAGGMLSPGDVDSDVGTLYVIGNVTLEAGAKVLLDFGNGAADGIDVAKGYYVDMFIRFEAGSEIIINIADGVDFSEYNFFSGENLKVEGYDKVTIKSNDPNLRFTMDETGLISVTQVPEPSTYGLIAGGVLFGAAAVFRRRRNAGA